MAHSYVDFRDRYVLMNDMALILILQLLIEQGRTDGDLPIRPREMLETWRAALHCYIPGCIDAELDKFVADETDRNAVLRLIDRVDQHVLSFGELIPATYVNELVDDKHLVYEDASVAGVRESLQRFRRVIAT